MISLLIKFFVWMNNFSYTALSSLVVREGKGLHPKHRIMQYHTFFVEHLSENDAVLDIGCGNGALAFDLSKKVRTVFGIDFDAKNIEKAKRKFPGGNIHYVVGDATSYAFPEKFDAIVLSNVLEHIDHRVAFLKKIAPLAPTLLIRVPLITRDWLAVYKKESGLEYRLDPTHYTEYSEAEFRKEVTEAGLTITEQQIKFGELFATITAKQDD